MLFIPSGNGKATSRAVAPYKVRECQLLNDPRFVSVPDSDESLRPAKYTDHLQRFDVRLQDFGGRIEYRIRHEEIPL